MHTVARGPLSLAAERTAGSRLDPLSGTWSTAGYQMEIRWKFDEQAQGLL